MTDLSIREPPKVLVPVAVLEGNTVPDALVRFLAPAEVVVLGYHVLPEQTPTEQAADQYGERAREAVADIAAAFENEGRTTETRVAFTHDRDETVERVAAEVGATATLIPNPTGELDSLLVALREAVDAERVADLVATLLDERAGIVTLLGLPGHEAAADAAHETLLERGFDGDRIREEEADDDSVHAVAEHAADFDAVVMGEGGATLLARVFGDDAERVAAESFGPVLVVRTRDETPGE